eukprot:EG_transcript_10815
MFVGVLYSKYEDWHDEPVDLAIWMREHPHYCFENHFIYKESAARQVEELVRSRRYDVFINFCDGVWDGDGAGIEVVKALEDLGVPFTGASSAFYEPSKAEMKRAALRVGIPTPPFVFAYDAEQVEEAVRVLNFDVIVKHFNGYASIGMTRNSVCGTPEALRAEAARFIETYGGALVEEFIRGREATVLVLENPADASSPIALTPVECAFPPGETFKHYELKWFDYEGLTWFPVKEPDLAEALCDAARRIFLAMAGVSYARCDFRICARTGVPYFLEVNPNCGICYPPATPGSADCILQADPLRHGGFLDAILRCALRRAGAPLPPPRPLAAGAIGPLSASPPATAHPSPEAPGGPSRRRVADRLRGDASGLTSRSG